MAGLFPAIHVFLAIVDRRKTWMPGTRPGMTIESPEEKYYFAIEPRSLARSLRRLRQDSPKIGSSK